MQGKKIYSIDFFPCWDNENEKADFLVRKGIEILNYIEVDVSFNSVKRIIKSKFKAERLDCLQ